MQRLDKKQIKKRYKNYDKRTQDIRLILENIQYPRNVAGIFRVADAAQVTRVYLTGVTHTPPFGKDLSKASRSTEKSVGWEGGQTTGKVIQKLRNQGFQIIAIQPTQDGIELDQFQEYSEKFDKLCFVAGSEVHGLSKGTLEKVNTSLTVPVYGKGASHNKVVEIALALFSFS